MALNADAITNASLAEVFLGPNHYKDDDGEQAITVVHEMLHIIIGTHLQIATALDLRRADGNLYDQKDDDNGLVTKAINNFLRSRCTKKTP